MRFRGSATAILSTALMLLTACLQQEAGIAVHPTALAQPKRDGWLTDVPSWHQASRSDGPVGEGNVARERVVLVPAETRPQAIRLLGTSPVRALDQHSLAELFPGDIPDGNALLLRAVERFENEGSRRERESKLELFKNDPRFLVWAAEWQAAAERERKLTGRLRPYLVRAVIVNEGTGGFITSIHADEFWIAHGSLGWGTGHKAPAVVFLEHEPKVLYVTANGAL